ncbi:alpha/beta hydrolase family protein [Burkholderia cepacia]|uniref:alpha/beta hydrolase family protein n=1 Tax=Burkholderia cepacia TaxID=292 RepID=UPI002AB6D79C|nr:CocE/NonD family hydrolase [Burkholderia cepacia]
MFKTWKLCLLIAIAYLYAYVPLAHAEDADSLKAPEAVLSHEKVIEIPSADGNSVMLQATLDIPDGPGPFPLVVMNHGANGSMPPPDQPRYHLTFSAYYFLSRGYAVVLPMMRGYAGSQGHLVHHGCDYAATGIEDAQDIKAVIDYMKTQPTIDGSRIVVAGQSFGGWNTLALGTMDVPGVRGLVSFAGGMNESDCLFSSQSLIKAAGELGAHSKLPSIWFFGDNDKVFSRDTWHAEYERYVSAGGSAELVAYGAFGEDAHNMLGSAKALPLWVPKLDAFLARIGMPHMEVTPEYMPTPTPPASGYAAIDDVGALPYIGIAGQAYYKKFLERPLPRAFAIGQHGAASTNGGFDPIAHAMNLCNQRGPGCRIYAVDNTVVWTRPTPVPPPSNFAKLDDASAIPYVSDSGRAGYQKFLQLPRPRVFTIAPDGGWDFSALGPDPVKYSLDHCGQHHQGCKIYAVDSSVVWQGTK